MRLRRSGTAWRIIPLALSLWLSVLLSAGCNGRGGDWEVETGGAEPSGTSDDHPAGTGACALLTQGEVNGLLGGSIGKGDSESAGGGVEICSWPTANDPGLLLQVSPSDPAGILASVELGAGYRSAEIEGLSGPAAIAVQEADDGEEALVTVVALQAGDKTIVMSPIGVLIPENSPRVEELKSLLTAMARRL